VTAPESSDPPASGDPPGGAATKPATELRDRGVTDRRRATALAGHTGDEPLARASLSDPAPAVRTTALGALDRLRTLTDDDLRTALADPSPDVRRRGCELAASRPGIDVLPALDDRDSSVAEMAAWSLGEREEQVAVPALAAMASSSSGHADPLCREAAVAALGAIGDPDGLAAVLDALDDKPAVRRRAAVALAAFVGPDVEAALRRCLDDRDWQVRQVAEDLLAVE
jgi:HEAT repeat protein